MSTVDQRECEHEITIAAPAAVVYRMIAEVVNWPRVFPPTIHVEQEPTGDHEERIRIWATANGEPKSWVSRRTLDPDRFRIRFQQEVSAPPVASMRGQWIIEPGSAGNSRVRLLHGYRAVDDDPESLAWIDAAVDRNSRAELAALRTNIESAVAATESTFSFEDSVLVRGNAGDVYDFVNEADRWVERLPHVASVRFEQNEQGIQTLEMDTRAKDGSTHRTMSYRVVFPGERIVYKQVTLPKLLALHTGIWTFTPTDDGVRATSQHTVVLNTDNIPAILGATATTADARDYVRNALSTNSRATLELAKAYAEDRASVSAVERP
ncbi:aromatase/cyclase [Nocardia sp. CDC159]|uniref:Aromatase/cyclase n=1 Tax=Nocardia pulmonis TaxID=2951408 RepID=A0A9X2EDJ0_9NOCA|nr:MULTISPECIES: aromatase/cyclase [Nocardia]MCM6778919.1 aromatase/cyclase [Nocardia pulmonis]MCM6791828.1 aromatase/cyclase [Nocardia sp. CDC159]